MECCMYFNVGEGGVDVRVILSIAQRKSKQPTSKFGEIFLTQLGDQMQFLEAVKKQCKKTFNQMHLLS